MGARNSRTGGARVKASRRSHFEVVSGVRTRRHHRRRYRRRRRRRARSLEIWIVKFIVDIIIVKGEMCIDGISIFEVPLVEKQTDRHMTEALAQFDAWLRAAGVETPCSSWLLPLSCSTSWCGREAALSTTRGCRCTGTSSWLLAWRAPALRCGAVC